MVLFSKFLLFTLFETGMTMIFFTPLQCFLSAMIIQRNSGIMTSLDLFIKYFLARE